MEIMTSLPAPTLNRTLRLLRQIEIKRAAWFETKKKESLLNNYNHEGKLMKFEALRSGR